MILVSGTDDSRQRKLDTNLFIDYAKQCDPDLHAQVVQPKHGRLEQEKADNE